SPTPDSLASPPPTTQAAHLNTVITPIFHSGSPSLGTNAAPPISASPTSLSAPLTKRLAAPSRVLLLLCSVAAPPRSSSSSSSCDSSCGRDNGSISILSPDAKCAAYVQAHSTSTA